MRRIVLVLTLSLTLAPLVAESQQAGKVARIGVFYPSTPPATSRNNEAFTQGLREHGYLGGRTSSSSAGTAKAVVSGWPRLLPSWCA
jgi:hypothetical protein